MDKKAPVCPNCNSIMTFFGEGGYGRCSNDSCKFEAKIDGCDTVDCDTVNLENQDIEHDPEA